MPFPAVVALFEKYPVLERICSSTKMRGTEFVSGSALPTWQPAEWSIPILLHLLCAPCAMIGSSWAGDAPTHSLDCKGHVCSASTTLRARLCSPTSCQSRCILLMNVFRRVWSYLWLSSKHPAVKKSCTLGLGCLTLELPFKLKLLWLIPLIYYFQCKKCESQHQQHVQEGLWVLLSWTHLPPEVTGMGSIFLIYFLDNLHSW